MKKFIPLLALGMSLSLGVAHAEEKKEPTGQQSKMTVCNKEAGAMKGEERKKFMSECLSGKHANAKQLAQQERMKTCNAEAKDKKGEERKKFMSECLKGK